MKAIFYITSKDFTQFLRERKTFMFLLIMPVAFTLMFGFTFKGAGQDLENARLPLGFLNQDGEPLSQEFQNLLASSMILRLEVGFGQTVPAMEKALADQKIAGGVIVPSGYSEALLNGAPLRLIVLADPSSSAGLSIQNEILAAASRMQRAVLAAQAVTQGDQTAMDTALQDALIAWKTPPVRLVETTSSAITLEPVQAANPFSSFAHSSPGMILQFAIAGLLTCAQVIVAERKNRCMRRILTTATSRFQILLGHYLAIFSLLFLQFGTLIVLGQLFLGLNYLSQPLAIFIIALTSALCIAALGLLIGALAKSEEQAIMFSLICMFAFSGLGGAWVPLEVTGETFQTIGHLTPIAWAMDGFKNVLIRGLDVSAALLPAAALVGYAVLFFALAVWRFKFE
jgi:ABC-2 type transport system permease protein